MKLKRTAFAFLMLLLLPLCTFTACNAQEVIDNNAATINEDFSPKDFFKNNTNVESTDDDLIYLWTDEGTGVQYVIYREKCAYAGFGGITPRLNPDGSLYIAEDGTEDTSEQ